MLINDTLHTTSPLRQRIRDYYRISESVAVDQILPIAEVNPRARSRAWERRKMVLQIRREQEGLVVLTLLNEYSLSTAEGVVLMCLASFAACLNKPLKMSLFVTSCLRDVDTAPEIQSRYLLTHRRGACCLRATW